MGLVSFLKEQSDLGLHCLLGTIFLTQGLLGISFDGEDWKLSYRDINTNGTSAFLMAIDDIQWIPSIL